MKGATGWRDVSGNFSASEYCNWRKKERVHHGKNIGETLIQSLADKQKTVNAKQKTEKDKQKTEND